MTHQPAAAPASSVPPAWWNRPAALPWVVLLAGALLLLRKPWALHTPQLWAEDGSIFLTQNDQLGLRAFLEPYNGYLHFLPRLIAWLASHLADVAWWPAIYNGFAFLVTLGLFARLASARIDFPGKPWLMLAFVLVVGTDEVLLTLTNLQWVTAFYLVLHLFTTRPATRWQALGDGLILVAVGLSGPFAVLFLPLFAWQAWRQRQAGWSSALGVVAVCALVQGFFLAQAGAAPETAPPAFQPIALLSVIGTRLFVWPVLGPHAVQSGAGAALALAGAGAVVTVLGWALRPHPRQLLRAQIVAILLVVTLAGAWRARMDTWAPNDLANGDRYFYIPRVLLAWLLVWEFDAVPRAVGLSARGLCLLGVVMHAPHFMLPAPPDYRWSEHCDPIRRGEPANISTLPVGWYIEYPGRAR